MNKHIFVYILVNLSPVKHILMRVLVYLPDVQSNHMLRNTLKVRLNIYLENKTNNKSIADGCINKCIFSLPVTK
jgi:hypothetical protein